jgi:hypothetical protein
MVTAMAMTILEAQHLGELGDAYDCSLRTRSEAPISPIDSINFG